MLKFNNSVHTLHSPKNYKKLLILNLNPKIAKDAQPPTLLLPATRSSNCPLSKAVDIIGFKPNVEEKH